LYVFYDVLDWWWACRAETCCCENYQTQSYVNGVEELSQNCESAYYLTRACPSVCQHGTTQLSLESF